MTDSDSVAQQTKSRPDSRRRLAAPIPFIDLAAQRARIGDRIDAAIARVLDHGRFILGPEVAALEEELAAFCGAGHAVGCANGTDALVLALWGLQIGPGDAVLVPAFTFSASAESVVLAGATPVFVEVLPDTFNVDPAGLVAGLQAARAAGLKPRALMAVDLFGQPADYDPIVGFCAENGLLLIDDAAQGFGGSYQGARIGTLATVTTTSFFPSKPLACYGDGGAILTDDADLADLLRSLRVHGQGRNKYDNVRIGTNSRLDTLQAAILLEKLAIFAEELELRQAVAARYTEAFAGLDRRGPEQGGRSVEGGIGNGAEAGAVIPPRVIDGAVSSWAIYTLRIPGGKRDAIRDHLAKQGIPSAVYYPKPLHRQPAYQGYPAAAELGAAEALCEQVLSLPMHPYLEEEVQAGIVAAVSSAVAAS
jgi:dTDP-4-amino-4,6-dideoxygalactose transaminase